MNNLQTFEIIRRNYISESSQNFKMKPKLFFFENIFQAVNYVINFFFF